MVGVFPGAGKRTLDEITEETRSPGGWVEAGRRENGVEFGENFRPDEGS
jgi:hypothetical protein